MCSVGTFKKHYVYADREGQMQSSRGGHFDFPFLESQIFLWHVISESYSWTHL